MDTICETPEASAIALAMSSPFGVGGAAFRTGVTERRYVDTVAFGAYTREAITATGLFDEALVRNQDDEYNYRLRKLGGRILLAPEIRSRYYSRSSLASLWRQYFQYGYYKVRVMQKHSRQMRLRQFAPPALVLGLAVALAFAPFLTIGKLSLALIAGGYLIASLLATAVLWSKAESRAVRLAATLPLCFVILHIAYGSGFWLGLVRFWNQWEGRRSAAVLPAARVR
jgi:GT2 family glycosyltransferase